MNDPLISVGLPVRNGARYLGETLSSILAQTHDDLEVVISDNGSTDRTQSICEGMVAEDPRVKYFRQERNIGGPANWNFVFEVSRGDFFKWATANDVYHPELLRRCYQVLREDEEVVLAYPRTRFIDAGGEITGTYEKDPDLSASDPCERFSRLVLPIGLNNAQQGLIRASALRATGLERNYESGDWPLMAELALMGRWELIPESLHHRRMAPETHVLELPLEQRRADFYPAASRVYLPFLRPYLAYWGVVFRSNLGLRQKLRLGYTLSRVLSWRRGLVSKDLKALITGSAFYSRRAVS